MSPCWTTAGRSARARRPRCRATNGSSRRTWAWMTMTLSRRGRSIMSLLELNDVSIAYGQRDAVKGISLQVADGGITTLLGGNGAGKTTILRAISGLRHARAGSIMFDGKDITRMPAHSVVQLGIAHCP